VAEREKQLEIRGPDWRDERPKKPGKKQRGDA